MNNFSNIAVIGAGIVGASIAFHLARRGAKVTLIDAGEPGKKSKVQPATAVSFAWMNARDKKWNAQVFCSRGDIPSVC